jgi:hypothetical protein
VPLTVWDVAVDRASLERHRDLGVARVVVGLPSASEILPMLDRWAVLMKRAA